MNPNVSVRASNPPPHHQEPGVQMSFLIWGGELNCKQPSTLHRKVLAET